MIISRVMTGNPVKNPTGVLEVPLLHKILLFAKMTVIYWSNEWV